MIDDAILELYSNVKQVIIAEDGNIKALDIDGNEVSIDMDAVNEKATELQTAKDNEVQANKDLKDSARQKLMDGEPLTEDEAKTIVL
tara:strand:- start:43 stop:303 length:261 start_codon:yes stop_codon:yes gene_type:complete